MSQLVLKTEFNGDVRRIPIPVNISFVELYQKIQKIYGFTSNFIFKYLDDENDLITIGSEEELEEAVRISVAKKILRLFINDSPLSKSFTEIPKESSKPIEIVRSSVIPLSQSVPVEIKLASSLPLSLSSSPCSYDAASNALLLRQQSLINTTSARVHELSDEINKKTAKLSAEQAGKATAPMYILPKEFYTNIDSLSTTTADKCVALSDRISAKQTELADLATSPQLQSKLLEIESNCNELSRKTNERCQDLSSSIFQRLMAL